jgi:transcriptional regulator with XRE-family HTH domain
MAMENTGPRPGDGAHRGRHYPPDTLGPILARARARSGLSVRQMARRAGISFGYLSMLERGRRCPSQSVALALAVALELDAAERAALYEAAIPNVGRDYPGPPDRERPTLVAGAR